MTASNETTNYKLPLFTDNDQPTWLGDFNGAMNKIDTDMNTVGANASAALSAANNAVNRVATVETTTAAIQTTANNAMSLAQTNETDIGTLDGDVAQLQNKFPVKAADLDSTAIAAMWNSQRVYRFNSADATADNTGMTGPSNYVCSGFYLADLQLVVIINGYLKAGAPVGSAITLPSYIPLAPRDIRVPVGCIEWNSGNYFHSWDAVKIASGTRNMVFEGRSGYETDHTNIIGTLVFYVGTGTNDNTSAVAYTNANGTFSL